MKLDFLGGAREVGRSSIFVELNKLKLLFDCGVKPNHNTSFPLVPPVDPDAVVVSHAHLDHSGNIPVYSSKGIPWFCTEPTLPLIELLLNDSLKILKGSKQKPYFSLHDLKKLPKTCRTLSYNETFEFFDGSKLSFLDAGHITGSAQVFLKENSGKSVLYTGDLKLEKTRLHSGALVPNEKVDVLITESTYAAQEHASRASLEKEFCKKVQQTVNEGKVALILAFAVDRTHEILMVLAQNNFRGTVFVDGMGTQVYEIMLNYPKYLDDLAGLKGAVKKTHFVSSKSRRRIGSSPSVIVSTAGMLSGGPAISYLKKLNSKGNGKVFMTGFQVIGTNGRMLLEQGKIRIRGRTERIFLEAEQFDFSAHIGYSQLLHFVRKISPQKVFCVHGEEEKCVQFAEDLKKEGFDAVAPRQGDAFEV
ncbi:MAG: MBL fold metallo-hydrolase [Candidatus Micrarchaeia archaeon]